MNTSSRTGCRVLAVAALLALASGAAAETPGQTRSTFVPRRDGPPADLSTPVVPIQAKTDPGKVPDLKLPDKGLPGPGPIPPAAPGTTGQTGPDTYQAYIRLDPPGRERLFGSRDTERELEERMRQERKDLGAPDPVQFPEAPALTTESYQTRQFAPTVVLAEPSYIVYRRLYFEEKNAERYGWDFGPIQPIVSTLYFLKDVACLPHNFASFPCRRFDTNAGQCMPGDPVPYLLYPPELTWTGMLAEAGVIGLLFYVIP